MTSTPRAHASRLIMALLCIMYSTALPAQDCIKNMLMQGDFERGQPTGNNGIDNATGWGRAWQNGSYADFYTSAQQPAGWGPPCPATGNYVSFWISNTVDATDPTYREGMIGILNSADVIMPGTGLYRLGFDMANMGGSWGTAELAVYAVHRNPSVPLVQVTGMHAPANTALFGPGNTVLLGTVRVPTPSSCQKSRYTITINSAMAGFPVGGMTHVFITRSDDTTRTGRAYCAFDNFCLQKADTTECTGDEIGTPQVDASCCRSTVQIINLNGGTIDAIEYRLLSPGSIADMEVLGSCASFSSTPAVINGSTQGVLTFTPTCSVPSFNLQMSVTPVVPITVVEVSVVHSNGRRCVDTLRLECKPITPTRCDRITMRPSTFGRGGTQLGSAIDVTIDNMIQPFMQICSVEVELATLQGTLPPNQTAHDVVFTDVTGSWRMRADYSLRPFNHTNTTQGGRPFSVIDLSPTGTQGPPASLWVGFTLAMPYMFNWVGDVTIRVRHCDGRTCESTFRWCALPRRQACPAVEFDTIEHRRPVRLADPEARLIAGTVVIPKALSADKIRIILSQPPPNARIVSVGCDQDKEPVAGVRQTSQQAFIDLIEPNRDSGEIEASIVVEVADQTTSEIRLDIDQLDEQGRVVDHGYAILTSTISSVENGDEHELTNTVPRLLEPVPNPASSSVQLNYWVPEATAVSIDIVSVAGQSVIHVPTSMARNGMNSIVVDTGVLAGGVYTVVMRSGDRISSQTVVIQR